MDEADAPRGVNMSLDDIIKENSKEKRLQNKNSNKGQQHGKSSNSRGRGRGGRGMGRGGGRGEQSYGRGGRGQQQAAQSYPQGYDQGFVQPERIVVVQEEVPDTSYRQFQDCYRDQYGNVIFTFKNSELVKVSRAGDVTLNTRGENGREFRGVTTLKSLNDALNCLDISVRPSNPKFPSDPAGHWNVLDGRALLRYREGLTLPAKGTHHAVRGQMLMAAIKNPEMPQASAATAASNAAAAQAGLIPPGPFGFGGGGFGGAGFGAPFMQPPFSMGPSIPGGGLIDQNGGYDASYSNSRTYGKDASQIRRDKARGRHVPY
ncbi:hypothetical protein ABBQ32_006422 [Trebouxia sp. C0010 RCD-2024]